MGQPAIIEYFAAYFAMISLQQEIVVQICRSATINSILISLVPLLRLIISLLIILSSSPDNLFLVGHNQTHHRSINGAHSPGRGGIGVSRMGKVEANTKILSPVAT